MYIKCIGERERERDSLLIRTRHRLGYRLGVYRRCMESGTNTVGNVPSLRMMDDRGRLYRQTIWKSRYGGGSNSIWWNGESKAARREGEVFANGPVLRNVRLLEGWFCLMKLLLEIIIFLWIEIELVFFFFLYWMITFEHIVFIGFISSVSCAWSLSLSYFVFLATVISFVNETGQRKMGVALNEPLLFFWHDN